MAHVTHDIIIHHSSAIFGTETVHLQGILYTSSGHYRAGHSLAIGHIQATDACQLSFEDILFGYRGQRSREGLWHTPVTSSTSALAMAPTLETNNTFFGDL